MLKLILSSIRCWCISCNVVGKNVLQYSYTGPLRLCADRWTASIYSLAFVNPSFTLLTFRLWKNGTTICGLIVVEHLVFHKLQTTMLLLYSRATCSIGADNGSNLMSLHIFQTVCFLVFLFFLPIHFTRKMVNFVLSDCCIPFVTVI